MSSIATTTFPYPPLPVGVDALRILILQPGDFSDPIKCTLTPAAFSMKPKYLALSYTWRDSYPDNSELPIGRFPDKKKKGVDAAIDVNDIPFYVRHNLRLALLHLRSPTQPLPIWADAICINQADTQERNAQVAIMSFIYMRALKVVTWLGVKDYGKRHLNPFHGMAMDWKAGQTRHLPTIVAASQDRQHCYSLEPDHATFARIVQSAYWPRLWIVQEVCLPRQLVVVYGSKMWKYEDLCQWDVLLKVRTSSISAEISPSAVTAGENANDPGIGIGAMIRLLDARDARHTSSTVLERLIETFAKSACVDLRDRIFALLGLAVDVRPYSAPLQTDQTQQTQSQETRLVSLETNPPRGTGWFRVDYSRSFYDLWVDTVKFVHHQAKLIDRWDKPSPSPAASYTASQRSVLLANERHISIVRTAGIIQEALDQQVNEERRQLPSSVITPETSSPSSSGSSSSTIRAMGYLSGEIVHLGPDHASLVASFQAHQDWLGCWQAHYTADADLARLRGLNEEYSVKTMGYEEADWAVRVRDIRNHPVITVAWRASLSLDQKTHDSKPDISNPIYTEEYDRIWGESDRKGAEESKNNNTRPTICLCTGPETLIATVPPAARVGDVIVRFWNCDAAVVMRPIRHQTTTTTTTTATATTAEENQHQSSHGQDSGGDGDDVPLHVSSSSFILVGRAHVAETVDRGGGGLDVHAEEALSHSLTLGGRQVSSGGARPGPFGAVCMDLDFPTLQVITACIET